MASPASIRSLVELKSQSCLHPQCYSTIGAAQLAHAVSWIRQHLAEEMRVGELAERANLSLTTFRQHFRSITGMSPVQFQKMFRLEEARQLILDQNMSAGRASVLVGYESASQFNRECRRLFGAPPQTDIRRMLSR